MIVILKIGIAIFNIIYAFLKLFPTQNKVLFLSRQSNTPSIDIKLLNEKIRALHPDYKTVILTRKIGDTFGEKIGYCFHMFVQAYHLATSRVVILDSYSILTSCLHHKKSLLVIQMWHSIGTMKKFGYSILDKPEGSSSKIAHAMHMHRNYDFIFASGDAYKSHLAEGFNEDISKIKTFALPRVELLKNTSYQEEIAKSIYTTYPELENHKKNIVYCPTFRKVNDNDFESALNKLASIIDYSQYNLILKLHPLDNSEVKADNAIIDNTFSTTEMLSISDIVISDYSCVIYEAAILNKPLYFYAYDFDEYMSTRDIYMNFKAEVPGPVCNTAEEISAAISKPYDMNKLKAFTDKYISPDNHDETASIVNFIFDNLK